MILWPIVVTLRAHTYVHSLALRSQPVSEFYQPHLLMNINFQCGLCHNPILHALPQDGWTAVLLAAYHGHQSLVQELCENLGAGILHRKKLRVMQTVSGSEWLSELHLYPIVMCGCTHRSTACLCSSVCLCLSGLYTALCGFW